MDLHTAKDLGELVFVKVGRNESPAYLVLNHHDAPKGKVLVQWSTRGDREYVDQRAIQQMSSRRGRRSAAPPPPRKKSTTKYSRSKAPPPPPPAVKSETKKETQANTKKTAASKKKTTSVTTDETDSIGSESKKVEEKDKAQDNKEPVEEQPPDPETLSSSDGSAKAKPKPQQKHSEAQVPEGEPQGQETENNAAAEPSISDDARNLAVAGAEADAEAAGKTHDPEEGKAEAQPQDQPTSNGVQEPPQNVIVASSSFEEGEGNGKPIAEVAEDKQIVEVAEDNKDSASLSDKKNSSARVFMSDTSKSPAPPRIEEASSDSRAGNEETNQKSNRKRPREIIMEESKSFSRDDRIFSCAKKLFQESDKNSTTVGDIIRAVETNLGVSFGYETKQRIQRYLKQLAITWRYMEAQQQLLDDGPSVRPSVVPNNAVNNQPTGMGIQASNNGVGEQADTE